jgi:class 3 adenylate cyclase
MIDGFFTGGLDIRLGAPFMAAFYETLAEMHTLIVFDWRNTGLSGPASDFRLSKLVGDIESVLAHAGIERFDAWAVVSPCHVALEFARLHPDRIRKLVLSRPSPPGHSPRLVFGEPVAKLASQDWEAFTMLYALLQAGWENGRAFMERLRKQWTGETFAAFMAEVETFDVFLQAPFIKTETLVMAYEGGRLQAGIPYAHVAREVAALLPNSQLLAAGRIQDLWSSDQARLVEAFLGPWETGAPIAAPPVVHSVRTILFTDVEAHTAMMQRLGDARGRDLLREHERLTREALRAHGGAEVKSMGDGFMASFDSAQRAVECAIALQQAFAGGPSTGPGRPEHLRIRVGINAGEPIAEDDDLFGSSVILAARTAAQASGGEVLLTDVVRQLVVGKGFSFTDRGEVALRGFEDPVRLYALRWSD